MRPRRALRALLAAGHAVTAVGRGVAAARRQWPEVAWVAQDIARLAQPADWQALLAGQDAVANCAGALQDSARDEVAALQDTAMRALFTATAVVAQPVTGALLAWRLGWSLTEGWVLLSLGLYVLAGLFWLPVVVIQLRLRDLARAAAAAGQGAAAALPCAVPDVVPLRHSGLRGGAGHPVADAGETGLLSLRSAPGALARGPLAAI